MNQQWLKGLADKVVERSENDRIQDRLRIEESNSFRSLVDQWWQGLATDLIDGVKAFNAHLPPDEQVETTNPEPDRLCFQTKWPTSYNIVLDRNSHELKGSYWDVEPTCPRRYRLNMFQSFNFRVRVIDHRLRLTRGDEDIPESKRVEEVLSAFLSTL